MADAKNHVRFPAETYNHPKPVDVRTSFAAQVASDKDMPVAVAAIQTLTEVIEKSKATTMMELDRDLQAASADLKAAAGHTITLSSACEIFMRFVTRTALDIPDFDVCKQRLLGRGHAFKEKANQSRAKIAELGTQFIRDGATIMVHGYSRVVLATLLKAASDRRFSVVVSEARPDNAGILLANVLKKEGIPVTLILDAAVAFYMEQVDFVLTGAEGVAESGGVINKIGTLQMAICAKAWNRPMYVAVESFKMARIFPLSQIDFPTTEFIIEQTQSPPLSAPTVLKASQSTTTTTTTITTEITAAVKQEAATSATAMISGTQTDYTPPQYITLLFTDLGVLTPSAVSDELIKMYY